MNDDERKIPPFCFVLFGYTDKKVHRTKRDTKGVSSGGFVPACGTRVNYTALEWEWGSSPSSGLPCLRCFPPPPPPEPEMTKEEEEECFRRELAIAALLHDCNQCHDCCREGTDDCITMDMARSQ
ncbi:MAG: hypothetical protein ACYTG5_13455, partial [Planctomycetota bacterium]